MAQPQVIRQCNCCSGGSSQHVIVLLFFLQYSIARDVNKISQTFSCNLEGNVRDRVQENQMSKNVRENGGCSYFVSLLG